MKKASYILLTLTKPSIAIQEYDSSKELDLSLWIGIIFGVINGLKPMFTDTFGLLLSIPIGIITTIFGLIIFSEIVKWISGLFNKSYSGNFRMIVIYSLIPMFFMHSILLMFPVVLPYNIFRWLFIVWSMVIMLVLISKSRKINYFEAGLSIIVAFLISSIPFAAYYIIILL